MKIILEFAGFIILWACICYKRKEDSKLNWKEVLAIVVAISISVSLIK